MRILRILILPLLIGALAYRYYPDGWLVALSAFFFISATGGTIGGVFTTTLITRIDKAIDESSGLPGVDRDAIIQHVHDWHGRLTTSVIQLPLLAAIVGGCGFILHSDRWSGQFGRAAIAIGSGLTIYLWTYVLRLRRLSVDAHDLKNDIAASARLHAERLELFSELDASGIAELRQDDERLQELTPRRLISQST